MTIDAPLAAALTAIGTVMILANDPWWIIGSAAVALHGADAGRVADVDVLLSISDAERVLPLIGIAPRRGPEHCDFRSSIFGTWTATPLPIEFMAGFCHRSGTEWRPVRPVTREPIDLGGVKVFVPGRAELCEILRSFDRPKDRVRASRLAELEG